MEEEAHRVFQRADLEGKGFLVKKDMQRFQHEVSLSADQLDAVFESLDACATGYLTLDQFLAGFSNLGNGGIMDNNAHEDYSEDCHNNNNCSNEQTIRNIINMDMLHKSGSTLKKLNSLITQESPGMEIEEGWLHFVQDLGIDMLRLKEQVEELERVLAARDKRHEIEVQKLFDEFDTQLSEEKEKMLNEMEVKESTLRHELKEELESKDNLISEVVTQRDEVLERLCVTQVEENRVKIQNASLLKQKEEHQKELECQQTLTRNLQEQLISERKIKEAECNKNFKEGFHLAQKITILEEEGLMQQLKILKEMQNTLKNGNQRRVCRKTSDSQLSNTEI